MELHQAEKIAKELESELAPLCHKFEIAGSIRRRRPFVHDIDVVLIPKNQGSLAVKFRDLGWKIGGSKLIRLTYHGAEVDIYFATPTTWATLLLVKTGSKENNVRLCQAAQRKGWKLKADGTGLMDGWGGIIASESEEGIYAALGLPYQEPPQREVQKG